MRKDRRTFLASAASASVAGLAGCTDMLSESGKKKLSEFKEQVYDNETKNVHEGIRQMPGGGDNGGSGIGNYDPIQRDPPTKSSDYEIMEPSGEIMHLRDGEVLENVIVDWENGDWLTIICHGNNAIRNVGFHGVHRTDQVAISMNGGDVDIANVYMGDGCIRPDQYQSHGQVGIFVHKNFHGTATISHCNIQNWPNNGIYGSAPSTVSGGKGGTVHIQNCYAANNYVSSYRISSQNSSVTNSVAFNDGSGRYTGRPFWGWAAGPLYVKKCDFDSGPYSGCVFLRDNGTLNITDTNLTTGYHEDASSWTINESGVGKNPDLSMPEGVPESPEMAASRQY